jgi:dephospho-CoA kinase
MQVMYVGITGTFGAGKGEIVRVLKRHGFVHYGFGDFLRELSAKNGAEPTIPNIAALANKLRHEHGPGYIAELLLHKAQEDAPKNAVFESIRSLGELEAFRRLPGFILISVDAPREIRWERIKHRGRRDGLDTFEAFAEAEDKQLEGKSHEQNILAIMDKADVQLVNAGDLEELESQVREALNI